MSLHQKSLAISNNNSRLSHKGKVEDNFFGGSVLCCESLTDSDIVQCNLRMRSNLESKVGGMIKESILK